MMQKEIKKTVEWLKSNPALDELCAEFPQEWASVQTDIATIVECGKAEELQRYLEKLSSLTSASSVGKSHTKPKELLSQYVRSHMAHEAVKKLCLSTLHADLAVPKGKLRFNFINGFIAQRLLFSNDLIRKPVSLFWFRLLWPLLWQRKRLMPLVQPKGIYCFYSQPLIEALLGMINGRKCLEIGAGDGTLSRFLKKQGVELTATDNHSWNKSMQYPDWILKMDARESLTTFSPEVVICSWPPAQNNFERFVFETPTVQLYIVIGSRHKFAFGNWAAYQQQSVFELEEDLELSDLVLPPELESVVYLFRRKELA
ncbi:MAG: hypothetical protein WCI39_04765 [Gallionellaceae bacterium]